jgi:pyruvate dehydrogenase E2 component (dihydrolipoamide acetyltransferase)
MLQDVKKVLANPEPSTHGPTQTSRKGPRRLSTNVSKRACAPLRLSLTFDHRVVTGGEAARFLVALKSNLERIS